MKILNICGARPNFMKIAPLMDAFKSYPQIVPLIVHTGQHYDANMSALFFDDLGIPKPDINLEVGSGSHARQTAEIMTRFEPIVLEQQPDAVLVVGDVNSTIACSLVATKLEIPVIHVEAGLRSFDRAMPEEVNRVMTDCISDLLLVSEPSGVENLRHEGIPDDRVELVGNVMIDTLERHRQRAEASTVHADIGVTPGRYGLVTMHRPSNVDDVATFSGIIDALESIQGDVPLVFCMHPRTRATASSNGLLERLEGLPRLIITPPQGYLEFLALMNGAAVIITDSGGMQEEATILGVPCLTARDNTERPITLECGTNKLVGTTAQGILDGFASIEEMRARATKKPPLWDGKAAERIAAIIAQRYCR